MAPVIALLFAPLSARAQAPEINPGDFIRVEAVTLSTLRHAQIRAAERDTLRVVLDMGGPPVPIALNDVVWLEVSRGRPGMRRAGVFGAGAGAALGLALGYAMLERCSGDTCVGFIQATSSLKRAAVVGGVGAAGAAIGFALMASTVREHWELLIDRRPPR